MIVSHYLHIRRETYGQKKTSSISSLLPWVQYSVIIYSFNISTISSFFVQNMLCKWIIKLRLHLVKSSIGYYCHLKKPIHPKIVFGRKKSLISKFLFKCLGWHEDGAQRYKNKCIYFNCSLFLSTSKWYKVSRTLIMKLW